MTANLGSGDEKLTSNTIEGALQCNTQRVNVTLSSSIFEWQQFEDVASSSKTPETYSCG